MKGVNLAAQFAFELAVLGALAWWGGSAADGAAGVALAVALPVLAATAWGLWGSPRARWHLSGGWRLLLQACFFGAGAAALAAVAGLIAGVAFAVLVAANIALLRRHGLDDRPDPR